MRGHRGLIAGLLAGTCLLALTPAAAARDAYVTSFDGTKIFTHFYPGKGAGPKDRAPTILQGPGWSSAGATSGGGGAAALFGGVGSIDVFIEHGFNVLTWDPRGFGQSGGTVQIDDPRYEGRDVQALLDFVARQPEAKLDRRCRHKDGRLACRTLEENPRVGMAGGSYGGGIQLVTAAIDKRVDAIAPTIAWHSLLSSLFPEGNIKEGWGSILIAAGIQGALIPGGLQDPAAAPGRHDPRFYDTTVQGTATGKIPQENLDWFDSKGPAGLVKKIKVPTLFLQGTVDTLFPLDEAITNFNLIRRHKVVVRTPNGIAVRKRSGRLVRRPVPTKMIWYCGGHGACFTGDAEQEYLDKRVLAWFDRYLLNKRKVNTGPRFAWFADDAALRTSTEYPLKPAGSLHGNGSGMLPIVPGSGSGAAIFATQAPIALNVNIPGPASPANVVGAPRLSLTYSGNGAPANTFVYAQIVNPRSNQVVGNIATPIPIALDGQPHTIDRELEMIAARAPAGGGYTLQLTPSSSLYDLQRSAGLVNFSSVSVELPLGEPAGQAP